jgi:hypothetical protein
MEITEMTGKMKERNTYPIILSVYNLFQIIHFLFLIIIFILLLVIYIKISRLNIKNVCPLNAEDLEHDDGLVDIVEKHPPLASSESSTVTQPQQITVTAVIEEP